MCPPSYFAVEYAINPSIKPTPASTGRAIRQWERLRRIYQDLDIRCGPSHRCRGCRHGVRGERGDGRGWEGARGKVPVPAADRGGRGLPGLVPGPRVREVHAAKAVNEGEGDILYTERALIAGYGFRSDPAARAELEETFGLPVIGVRLVDPRFYHLDTALCVLDADTAAYYPAAFDDAGRAALAAHFEELIEAKDKDVQGPRAECGKRRAARRAARPGSRSGGQLAARGFEPVPVDMSELRKAGGGPKCCTLELRP